MPDRDSKITGTYFVLKRPFLPSFPLLGSLLWLTSFPSSQQASCMQHILQYYNRSEGFALTGYDIPRRVEDGGWMLWENSSVAAVVVAHPDLGNGQLSVFITTSALPECADRSVSSSEYRAGNF